MTKKIMWDEGHGGRDPGAVANGLQEKNLVVTIVRYAMEFMRNNYTGFEQRSTRNLEDKFIDLSPRAAAANSWNADVFVSAHINAGGGRGFETFVHPNAGAATVSLQNVIHAEIMATIRRLSPATPDRGKKKANFAVVRETRMPAVLTETLFIDSSDSTLLKNAEFLKAVGEAHARGVAKYLGLPARQQPQQSAPTTTGKRQLFKVQVGAFSVRKNAENLQKEIQKAGFKDTFILTEDKLHKVQVGAFSVRSNAETLQRQLQSKGFKDTFIRFE